MLHILACLIKNRGIQFTTKKYFSQKECTHSMHAAGSDMGTEAAPRLITQHCRRKKKMDKRYIFAITENKCVRNNCQGTTRMLLLNVVAQVKTAQR